MFSTTYFYYVRQFPFSNRIDKSNMKHRGILEILVYTNTAAAVYCRVGQQDRKWEGTPDLEELTKVTNNRDQGN